MEIFANVYEHPNENQNDDDEFACLDSLLDQTLHEDDNSLNLNDLLIPEVCLGNSALSILDVSDNTKCRYCFIEFNSKEECLSHIEVHKGDDKPYKCPQEGCESSFKARKNLKDHYLGKMVFVQFTIHPNMHPSTTLVPFQYIQMNDRSHATFVSKHSSQAVTDRSTNEGSTRRNAML